MSKALALKLAIARSAVSLTILKIRRKVTRNRNFPVRTTDKTAADFASLPQTESVQSPASGIMDNIIEAKELQIERKHFYVELRENERGKFLRITEEAHGRRNSIIVPSSGVDDFTALISEVLIGNGSEPA